MPNMSQVQGTQEESPLHSQSGGGGKNRHNGSILEIGTITNRSQEVWATQGGNYNYLREEGESRRMDGKDYKEFFEMIDMFTI